MFTCNVCTKSWTGQITCHCSACHQTFGGETLFDRHRAVGGEHNKCIDPATAINLEGERVMWLVDGVWRSSPDYKPPVPPRQRAAAS